jgi:hypothetical protein
MPSLVVTVGFSQWLGVLPNVNRRTLYHKVICITKHFAPQIIYYPVIVLLQVR